MNNIEEGNKIIAEFDGAYYDNVLGKFRKELNPFPSFMWTCSIEDLKYHRSWDWLMPSWGKLSSLLLAKGAFELIEEFKNAVVKNDINEAWNVLVKGIKLINE